jgi:serine protease Do
MEVLRKGKRQNISVTVQKLADDEKVASADKPAPKGAQGSQVNRQLSAVNLGMTLAPVTQDARRRFKLDPKVEGVVITDVDADSPAGQKNIRAGDVITEVAQQRVTSPDEVTAKLDAERKAGHKVVLLQVSRGGELTFIGVRIP